MSCEEFEHLLLDYAGLDDQRRQSVDAHVVLCEHCGGFRDALAEVDATLERELELVRFSPDFASSTLRRVPRNSPRRRPSFAPELLDFAGWLAVLSVLAVILVPLVSRWDTSPVVIWLAAGVCGLTIAIGAGVRALVDLNADS